jgi:D-arginine utilization repressor
MTKARKPSANNATGADRSGGEVGPTAKAARAKAARVTDARVTDARAKDARAKDAQWQHYVSIIEGIVALLHPHAEVVVHDVASDRVLAIWNAFSGRAVGDASLLGELPDHEVGFGVLGPYEKVGVDGHRITSVTMEIANGEALVCINLDRFALDSAIDALQRFAQAVVPQPAVLFERDWREEISRVVDEWCRQQQVDRTRLIRAQRVALVRVLDDKGLFATRNAGTHIGKALGLSRATIYSLLQEARS